MRSFYSIHSDMKCLVKYFDNFILILMQKKLTEKDNFYASKLPVLLK